MADTLHAMPGTPQELVNEIPDDVEQILVVFKDPRGYHVRWSKQPISELCFMSFALEREIHIDIEHHAIEGEE